MDEADLKSLSDNALVELTLARREWDNRPFRELFQRYQTLVWRICYGMFHNAEDAEDMTQEVFFKVYRSLDKFEMRAAFKTWLYRIAVNTCQNEIRRRSRRPQASDTPVEEMAEYLPGEGTPEEAWLEQLRNRNLAAAIAKLKPAQREAIRLKDFEERQYDEIADILGIGLSAAKMRVQRARLLLQQLYNELEHGGENV